MYTRFSTVNIEMSYLSLRSFKTEQKKKESISMFKYSIFIVGRSENERTDCDGIGDSVRAGGRRCALDSTGTPCFVNYARVLSFFNWVPVNVCTSHINSTLCCVYTWQIKKKKSNYIFTTLPFSSHAFSFDVGFLRVQLTWVISPGPSVLKSSAGDPCM